MPQPQKQDKEAQNIIPPMEPDMPKHRINEVRIAIGMTRRDFAKGLGLNKKQCDYVLNPASNLKISHLGIIGNFLKVPPESLLIDRKNTALPISAGIRLMKTVEAIKQNCDKESQQDVMTDMLMLQINEAFNLTGKMRDIADNREKES